MTEKTFYSVKEIVSQKLIRGFKERKIRELIKLGLLESVVVSTYTDGRKGVRVSEEAIQKYLKNGKNKRIK